ncbi:bifunctional diguanylate cyclase/phosphodiesterase [Thiomicrorhabdus sp. Kp2]|uniref:putative bifunctional diguanylate cyclase/phosphodiesterase n=1 Tax=Thiomicrorhabdus sp. Kp2 TaxID=1123518 RepID=UPI000420C1CB|nr:bifunctional diguanylate cyclase/phosphodiesterase [Thiomicrorhabdus sp. Kp2]
MKNTNKPLPSLRKRYVLSTILIGAFVISIVSLSYQNLIMTKKAVTSGYEGILKEQTNLINVRNTLLIINQDINLFLLDPLNENLTQKIEFNIHNAQENLHALKTSNHAYHIDLTENTELTNLNFNKLKKEVDYLVKFRLDVNKQYPGLDISANIMASQQNTIKSGFEILINEIEAGEIKLNSPQIYPLLLKSHAIWINAISQTRIYMANRLASFSYEILEEQSQGLKDIHSLFMANIKKLEMLYANENSFESKEILESTLTISQSWYENFVSLREISESDKWRSDTLIIKTRVFPLLSKISENINAIENTLREEKHRVDTKLKDSDDTFNMLTFSIIGLFLFFIFAILISMQWMLFSPIEKVTQALKSRAFHVNSPNIQTAKTREIGQLIDAYIEMNKEVVHRQNALEHQAMHDHLTGLPNRFLLHQRIEYQLLNSERNKRPFVLFLMDLDFFKDINDTLGHAAGDRLLTQVSKRINSLIRKSDTLARLGGDEFSILLPDSDKNSVLKLTESIIENISQPIQIDNQNINIGISIGIVSYPEDGKDIETLLQYADMAMYTAKRKRTGYSYYKPEQNIYTKKSLNFIHDVSKALEEDQFEVYFQPKLSSKNNQICGAEALLRWHHEEHGFISPEKIIEAAERTGVIQKLSINILDKALSECSKWHLSGHKISVSVNLSVRDLANKNLTAKVKELMDREKLPYHFLTLEITESVMMENLAFSLDVLNKLHDLGVYLSIDDFGTGFSSLAYLKRLPVDELKIDRSFIMEINEDANDKKIVSSTINLGHNLGLNVVAEGIETEKVMNLLTSMGCDQMQGYFIGKPMPSEQFIEFIKKH